MVTWNDVSVRARTYQPAEVMVFLLGLVMCCCLFFLGLYSTRVHPAG